MLSLLIGVWEEELEFKVFPPWLRAAPITRFEKWILGISSCPGTYLDEIRSFIKKRFPKNYNRGVVLVSGAINDFYNEISEHYVHPTARKESRIPTTEEEERRLCAIVAGGTADEKNPRKCACQLIIHMQRKFNEELPERHYIGCGMLTFCKIHLSKIGMKNLKTK